MQTEDELKELADWLAVMYAFINWHVKTLLLNCEVTVEIPTVDDQPVYWDRTLQSINDVQISNK